MLIFEQSWRKLELTQRRTSQSKGENQQQTSPSYGIDTRVWNQDMLVGGECSHHYALSPLLPLAAPSVIYSGIIVQKNWFITAAFPYLHCTPTHSSASWKTDALFNLISCYLFNICFSSSTWNFLDNPAMSSWKCLLCRYATFYCYFTV